MTISLFRTPWSRKSRTARRATLNLESLEDRRVLSGNVLQTNLVSDLSGVAQIMDPHLVNPWGIATSAASPFWVADNNAGLSTLYSVPGANNTPVSINPLAVSIPAPGDPLGASGTPTGTVFNIDGGAAGGFKVSGVDKTGKAITASAIFLFATEDGTIVGWNPTVNPKGFNPAKAGTYGIIAVDNSANPTADAGAVYKGLAIATDANGRTLLYAANFRTGKVDVFGADFKPEPAAMLPAGAFTDPDIPKGYAPFDVQVLNGQVYVTYAKQNKDKHDDVAGPHRGFVDVFNLDGSPGLAGGKVRLVSRGPLDSPWGLAVAPTGFAGLSAPNGDSVLLVGNFGNGRINAFDAKTGNFLGGLKDPDGEPIRIDGLWALRVGNGGAGGAANTVYFTAGLDGEQHGLFGSLATAAPGSPEGMAEAQSVQAALDVFQIDRTTLENDLANKAPKATLRQDFQTLQGDFVALLHVEKRFVKDSRADHDSGDQAAAFEREVKVDMDELIDLRHRV